jgi:hypothetical protein
VSASVRGVFRPVRLRKALAGIGVFFIAMDFLCRAWVYPLIGMGTQAMDAIPRRHIPAVIVGVLKPGWKWVIGYLSMSAVMLAVPVFMEKSSHEAV